MQPISNDDYAWSAVAISYIARHADYAPADFPIFQSHSTYIRRSIRARKKEHAASFWDYRADEPEAVRQIGTLVGCARGKAMSAA